MIFESLYYAFFGAILAAFYCQAQIDNEPLTAPAYDRVPRGLKFSCQSRIPGYYADVETRCQVWHWCLPSGVKFSFLCPNGTVFNQNFRVCDWWSNVNCALAEERYKVNEDLYRNKDGAYI